MLLRAKIIPFTANHTQVICTLCQWMDEKSGFVPVATFSVSESTPVAVEVKPHPPARLWSIMVSGVEWTELEEGGHEINNRFVCVGHTTMTTNTLLQYFC